MQGAAKKRMRFFMSPAGQEEEMIQYWASITPVQRLKHLHEMVTRAYGIMDGQKRNGGNSVTITQYLP